VGKKKYKPLTTGDDDGGQFRFTVFSLKAGKAVVFQMAE
jgi:hypothetical protein